MLVETDVDPRVGVRRTVEARLRARGGARAGGGRETNAVPGRARRVSRSADSRGAGVHVPLCGKGTSTDTGRAL